MAVSSAFHERLHDMDRTRFERLSLLQAEKELQANKSRVLASKLANIRASEQRCFLLDHKIASQNFNILALKSQIQNLEAKYDSVSQDLRLPHAYPTGTSSFSVYIDGLIGKFGIGFDFERFRSLQDEVEELEELDEGRERFYEGKRLEMKQFKEVAETFVLKCQMEVESLRNRVNELRSCFVELRSNNTNSSCNSEIGAAEMRRLELMAEKESVCRNLASNHQIKAQLQKQLQSILMTQAQHKGN